MKTEDREIDTDDSKREREKVKNKNNKPNIIKGVISYINRQNSSNESEWGCS